MNSKILLSFQDKKSEQGDETTDTSIADALEEPALPKETSRDSGEIKGKASGKKISKKKSVYIFIFLQKRIKR